MVVVVMVVVRGFKHDEKYKVCVLFGGFMLS